MKIRKIYLITLVLFLSLFTFVTIAMAQKEPDVIAQPLKINGKEVKEYLIEKYQLRKHDVTSTLQQTPNGPRGKLHARVNFVPIAQIIGKDRKERARALAKAFLREEAALLDIKNMDEIREEDINTFKGYGGDHTNVRYRRYINKLELEYFYIVIHIAPNENITRVSAELVPVPPELYQAVKKDTLTKAEIRRIIEQDLKAAAESSETTPFEKSIVRNWLPYIKTMEMKKLAISSPPYVIWKAESGWVYTINAFTGEILNKDPNWIIN